VHSVRVIAYTVIHPLAMIRLRMSSLVTVISAVEDEFRSSDLPAGEQQNSQQQHLTIESVRRRWMRCQSGGGDGGAEPPDDSTRRRRSKSTVNKKGQRGRGMAVAAPLMSRFGVRRRSTHDQPLLDVVTVVVVHYI
jgi:hypothetical protein